VVDAVMQTGRKHQIRRHFALAGVPVMGDPLYGRKNKNAAGLKLRAWGIEFTDPFSGKPAAFEVPAEFLD
jgi:tRNA pseudouridine32 synthase/23S rRNA pseudouridine746 synthase